MRGALAILAVAGLMAGCAAPDDTTTTSTSTTDAGPRVPAAFQANITATGCSEAVMTAPVTLEHAQSLVPANWTAADLGTLLETPATGQGAAWISGYRCDTAAMEGGPSSGFEVGILVHAPKLAGNRTDNANETAGIHVYLLSQAGGPNLANLTAPLGLEVVNATVTHTGAGTAGFARGELAVTANGTVLHSFNYAAVQDEPFSGTANFWRESELGVLYFHYSLANIPVQRGSVTACALSGGAAQAAGFTACPPGQGLVLVAAQQEWTGSLHWLPGVHTTQA